MTWHLNRTGHLRLADGSVLRLDAECRQYCASWYQPLGPDQQLILRAYSYGSFDAMKDLVDSWADAFELSQTSPLSVGERGAASGVLTPAQPPLNKREAV